MALILEREEKGESGGALQSSEEQMTMAAPPAKGKLKGHHWKPRPAQDIAKKLLFQGMLQGHPKLYCPSIGNFQLKVRIDPEVHQS